MSTIISLSQPASPKEFHVCIMCVKQKEKPEVSDEGDCSSANSSSRASAKQLDSSVSIANCANGSLQLNQKNEMQSNECQLAAIPAYCQPIENSASMNNATNMCSNHVTLSVTAPAAVSTQSDQM